MHLEQDVGQTVRYQACHEAWASCGGRQQDCRSMLQKQKQTLLIRGLALANAAQCQIFAIHVLKLVICAGSGGETTRPSPKKKQKRPTPKKAAQRTQRSMVVEQFAPASVAGVIQESSALKGALVYFVPSYSRTRHSKAELEAMVARLGGKVHILRMYTQDKSLRRPSRTEGMPGLRRGQQRQPGGVDDASL